MRAAIAPPLPVTLGPARLGRMFENGHDLAGCIDTLIQRATGQAADAGAMLDLAVLSQFAGDRTGGLALQAQALAGERMFETVYGDGSGLTLLAFVAPGDLTANTPLDFLLESSNIRLLSAYLELSADMPDASAFPEHDVAIVAVGESPETAPLLRRIAARCAHWPRPLVNGRCDAIAQLTRDGVATAFAGEDAILAPQTRRLPRDRIDASALAHPITIRPVGTQAGKGLERVEGAAALSDYLSRYADAEFYVSDFIDYSGADGLYRKQRIVFIDRVPYISHLAISENWIVHYMSAGMADNARSRHEEARFLDNFDADFVPRHRAAFDILCDRIDLDYFGIDCGETRDGRLLLFEADVAMIVHSVEDGADFRYKKAPMNRLFAAFAAMLERRADVSVTPLPRRPAPPPDRAARHTARAR